MRNYLVLFINGKQHRISGEAAFMPLSSFLRYEQGAVGTKVVCEEGDCGACTVMLGRSQNGELSYKAVNSCIQFLYQLDCTHIVTIEGLKYKGQLNPVQEAMVSCHGAQCGYCTPGFVVAMCAMFEQCNGEKNLQEQQVKDGLTGNLCRCTGYEPIIKAGVSVDADEMLKLGELYPSKDMQSTFAEQAAQPVLIETPEHTFYKPVGVADAVKFKAEHPGTVLVAGGTDICVYWNKRALKPASLMSVSHLSELDQLEVQDGRLLVGAKTTLSQMEAFIKDRLPEFHHILWLFGSPQIRNAGTLAGNIANGSPIADSVPFLHVMEAELELTSPKGKRNLNINQFYNGYKKLDLADDEMITRIAVPLPAAGELIRLYKVSKRRNLDISAFTAAFKLKLEAGSIAEISVAYGGVAPVILRMRKTEEFLRGKQFSLDTLSDAGAIARSEITPISDVRGSSDFRYTLAENILRKLYYEIAQPEVAACRQ